MGVWVKEIPTMPLKEISLARVFVPDRPVPMRRANSITQAMQRVVERDWIMLRAREAWLSCHFRGHSTAEIIHWRRLTTSLKGRTWKTPTQRNC